jgi:hypothetical protein
LVLVALVVRPPKALMAQTRLFPPSPQQVAVVAVERMLTHKALAVLVVEQQTNTLAETALLVRATRAATVQEMRVTPAAEAALVLLALPARQVSEVLAVTVSHRQSLARLLLVLVVVVVPRTVVLADLVGQVVVVILHNQQVSLVLLVQRTRVAAVVAEVTLALPLVVPEAKVSSSFAI